MKIDTTGITFLSLLQKTILLTYSVDDYV